MDEKEEFEAAWSSIRAELPSHQRNLYGPKDVELAEREAAFVAWKKARASLPVGVPDSYRMVKVGVEGVQFGNAWFSHEHITGYTAEQLNSGNCRITGRAYLDWLAAAPTVEGVPDDPLPHWEPCNPGCDPEFNGSRSRHCAELCHNAREALTAPTFKESLSVAKQKAACTKPGCFPYCDCGGVDDYSPAVKAEQVDMADAYVGAREDLTIWKRRALEAEQKARRQEQIIDHLTLEAQGETRFGEPSLPAAGSAVGEVAKTVGYLHACVDGYDPDADQPAAPEPLMTVAQHNRIVAALSAQQAGAVSVPEVVGIGRDADHPRALVLYLRTEPSDDNIRVIQGALRALLSSAGGMNEKGQ